MPSTTTRTTTARSATDSLLLVLHIRPCFLYMLATPPTVEARRSGERERLRTPVWLWYKSRMTELIRDAMILATSHFGGNDGVFNAANFSQAFRTLCYERLGARLVTSLDGHVVRGILAGREDVDMLYGGNHFRVKEI